MLRPATDPPPPPRRPAPPTLLVGYDGSPPARAAVRWSLARAGRVGRVFVGHVVEPDFDAARRALRRVMAECETDVLVVGRRMRAGPRLLGSIAGEAAEGGITAGDGRSRPRRRTGRAAVAMISCLDSHVSVDTDKSDPLEDRHVRSHIDR
jgi:nucleotide-binding universal stress UspA family protein